MNTPFYGREAELNSLAGLLSKKGFKLAVVYGRRRVGKSTLILHFLNNSKVKNVVFQALERTEKYNLEQFSQAVLNTFPRGKSFITCFTNWEKAFDYIIEETGNASSDKQTAIFIDEFPYLAECYHPISSIIQKYCDTKFQNSNLTLILCGSSMSFMENQVLGYKSPLFGRRDMQIKVEPFDYIGSSQFFASAKSEDKLLAYSCTGGVPLYMNQLAAFKTVNEGIKSLFFKPNGFLYEEPSMLLKQEFRTPNLYESIIEAIALGNTKLNEISNYVKEAPTKVSKYISSLILLKIIYKENPVGDKSPKKGIYKIVDQMFRFYYYFVPKNNLYIIRPSLIDTVYNSEIEVKFNKYLGFVFEEVAKQYCMRVNGTAKLPFIFNTLGRWWGNNPIEKKQEEIDIVATNDKKALFGECKYTEKVLGLNILKDLMRKSELLTYQEKYFVLFAKKGFTQELIKYAALNNVTLVTLNELYAV